MFEKYFNRKYEMEKIPYFVSKDEKEGRIDWAEGLIKGQWVSYRWREDVERGGWKRNIAAAEKIAGHGGLILEICAGPGAGFAPAVLMKNYKANIMISDLSPTVVREWYGLFNKMNNPPPNIEFAVFDVCDMPFIDNSLDVVSGSAAIINIKGNRDLALKEIYRVLKTGGLFVFDYIFVSEEHYNQMPIGPREIIKENYPTAFWDSLEIFDELGYSEVETIVTGQWSNKDDESDLADLCRSLNSELIFSGFIKYCKK
jgi:SAM-dependent methyltransferase